MADTDEKMSFSFGIDEALLASFSLCLISQPKQPRWQGRGKHHLKINISATVTVS